MLTTPLNIGNGQSALRVSQLPRESLNPSDAVVETVASEIFPGFFVEFQGGLTGSSGSQPPIIALPARQQHRQLPLNLSGPCHAPDHVTDIIRHQERTIGAERDAHRSSV